jgi:hypothetical protein
MSRETSESTHLSALAAAESRIASLEARLSRLESGSVAETIRPVEAIDRCAAVQNGSTGLGEVSSRRGLFKVAGAVATAAVTHNLMTAGPAAASAAGPFVGLGQADNSIGTDTSITRTGTGGAAIIGTNLSTIGAADGVRGVSDSTLSAGVSGQSASGYGVYGSTSTGYAMYSNGRFGLGQHLATDGPPTGGKYEAGDMIRDAVGGVATTGNVWVCIQSGTPGVWRKVAGPKAAGQFHFASPVRRVYDTRLDQVNIQAAAQGGQGPFTNAVVRTVSLGINFPGTTAPLVPLGATGVLVGIAAFSISGGGFVTLYPTGTTPPNSVLHAFWGDTVGHQAASLAAVELSANRQFDIKAAGGTVSIALDVYGYFL